MGRRFAIASLSAVAIATALVACARSSMPTAPLTSHPTSALVPVPYPPPPARVEIVPDRPSTEAVWIDGEWIWQNARWAWRPGGWFAPPRGTAYAPWTTVRDTSGALYFARGAWLDKWKVEVQPPRPLVVAKTTFGTIVDPEGENVPQTAFVEPWKADIDASVSATAVATGDAAAPAIQVPEAAPLPEDASFDAVEINDAVDVPDAIPLSPRRGAAMDPR